MKRIVYILSVSILLFLVTLGTLNLRWKHLWAIAEKQPHYAVHHLDDDTLRVVMIGDSWAYFHSEKGMDSLLYNLIGQKCSCPVSVVSKGKGGECSKAIYHFMFEYGEYGTRSLLKNGPKYCILSAGINDACRNYGTEQFCTNYRLILEFLLSNGIRPVVIEVPDVDLWINNQEKAIRFKLTDFLRSVMTGCRMYDYREYREALVSMLHSSSLMDKIIYIPMNCWNGEGTAINKALFFEDCTHLNRKGYSKLDSCIAEYISQDFNHTQHE